MSASRQLDRCLNILDLRALAKRRLPRAIYAALVGAADDETTLARNRAAFEEVYLVPKALVDVSAISTATRILGQQVASPFFCSPTGLSRLFHPDGEIAVARAAAAAGLLYGCSVNSTIGLEAVAAATPGPKLFQLLPFRDRGLMDALVDRCCEAGYQALGLTIDTAVRGNCERDARSGLGRGLSLANLPQFMMKPRWSLGQVRKGPLYAPLAAEQTGRKDLVANGQYLGAQLDPSFGWRDAEALAAKWGGPFAIKGVMAPADAKRAVDAGASAVILSNHGGRQLDGAAAPLDVLPEIADAVRGRAEIILDGGIHRGTHILKALALGATSVSIGRAYLYGLAAGGEAGVARSLAILQAELQRAMQLSGCGDIKAIDPSIVRAIGIANRAAWEKHSA